MGELSGLRKQLHSDVLHAYEEEHARLESTWDALDNKAQATVAIAGIFIAGTLALAKDATPETGTLTRIFILVPTFILIATVWCAVLALRVRSVQGALEGDNVHSFVEDLLAVETAEELSARLPRYLADQSKIWSTTNSELHLANERKAAWIEKAQWLLFVAIIAAALLVGWELFVPARKSIDSTPVKGGQQHELLKAGVQAESRDGQQLLQRTSAKAKQDQKARSSNP